MNRMAGLMAVACFRTGTIWLRSRPMEKAPRVSSYVYASAFASKSVLPSGWRR